MMKSFQEIQEAAYQKGGGRIAVAGAEGAAVLEAVLNARSRGIMDPILVGDSEKIQQIAGDHRLDIGSIRVVNAADETIAAGKAVQLVHEGEADGLMKGKVSTPMLLKTVLDKKYNLRSDRLLSHIALLEISGYHKLLLVTDGGMVIRPDLNQKSAILSNGLDVLRKLGVSRPKAAVLAAIEKVNPDMPETQHAEALVEAARKGRFGDAVVEGPLAVDVALSRSAAEIKGIESRISGNPDLFLMPDIACGNIFAKGLVYMAGAKIGGLIVGARKPIILLSRADDAETKFRSIALGSVVAAA
ncbi:MAG TPA: bifunctional enoyl-CoA hydratase/phosphate acetyltransferase [bacterium]|nr:bifunctional enoyl-CoA hydratase/phosphate acetyltransferase [bacterium]